MIVNKSLEFRTLEFRIYLKFEICYLEFESVSIIINFTKIIYGSYSDR